MSKTSLFERDYLKNKYFFCSNLENKYCNQPYTLLFIHLDIFNHKKVTANQNVKNNYICPLNEFTIRIQLSLFLDKSSKFVKGNLSSLHKQNDELIKQSIPASM